MPRPMLLLLIQHGEATDKLVDPDRPLTDEGRRAVAAVAKAVCQSTPNVFQVWHSDKKRAEETAQIVGEILAPEGRISKEEGLRPNDPVRPMVKRLAKEDEDTAIVGHLPFLSRLAGLLFVEDERAAPIAFQKGGIVALERDAMKAWHVCWIVVPGLIRE